VSAFPDGAQAALPDQARAGPFAVAVSLRCRRAEAPPDARQAGRPGSDAALTAAAWTAALQELLVRPAGQAGPPRRVEPVASLDRASVEAV